MILVSKMMGMLNQRQRETDLSGLYVTLLNKLAVLL